MHAQMNARRTLNGSTRKKKNFEWQSADEFDFNGAHTDTHAGDHQGRLTRLDR